MNYMVTILTEHVEENVAAIQIFRYACKSFSIERIFFQKKKGLNSVPHVSTSRSVYLCFPFPKSYYNQFFHVSNFCYRAYRYISMSITKTTQGTHTSCPCRVASSLSTPSYFLLFYPFSYVMYQLSTFNLTSKIYSLCVQITFVSTQSFLGKRRLF